MASDTIERCLRTKKEPMSAQVTAVSQRTHRASLAIKKSFNRVMAVIIGIAS